jgi:hypothetical protein
MSENKLVLVLCVDSGLGYGSARSGELVRRALGYNFCCHIYERFHHFDAVFRVGTFLKNEHLSQDHTYRVFH